MKSRHFHPGVPARGEIRAVASREEDVRVCRFPDCFIKNEFALQISPASFHFRCQAGGALQVVVQYAYLHPVRAVVLHSLSSCHVTRKRFPSRVTRKSRGKAKMPRVNTKFSKSAISPCPSKQRELVA